MVIEKLKKFILFFIFFFAQMFILISLPYKFSTRYTPERIEKTHKYKASTAQLKTLRKSLSRRNFLNRRYDAEYINQPFDKYVILKFARMGLKKPFLYLIATVSFLVSSLFFVNLVSQIKTFTLKVVATLLLLISNPGLSLIIYEPYSLLALSLLFILAQKRSFLSYSIATILNPVLSFIFFCLRTFPLRPLNKSFVSALGLALGLFFYHYYLPNWSFVASIKPLGVNEILVLVGLRFIDVKKLNFFKALLSAVLLFYYDYFGVYTLYILLITLLELLQKHA